MSETRALQEHWESCPACGTRNNDGESRCEKCGRSLRRRAPGIAPALSTHTGLRAIRTRKASAAPAFPEGIRRQLSAQVQEFRLRRLNGTLPLQFEEGQHTEEKVIPLVAPRALALRAPGRNVAGARSRRPAVSPEQQPALEFPSPAPTADFALPPVAPLRLRMHGQALDCAITLAALAMLLAPLKVLAGSVELNRFLVAGSVCAYGLIAVLYGFVFLYLASATPGMKRMGLRLVNFDGLPASRRQRLWRLAGTIVSAGSFLLGFLWAAVDEETLSWHDRISKTFLTIGHPSPELPSRFPLRP